MTRNENKAIKRQIGWVGVFSAVAVAVFLKGGPRIGDSKFSGVSSGGNEEAFRDSIDWRQKV